MDWLTFLASLVGSLAWPLTLLVALLMFRGALTKRLADLSTVKWKDFQAEFGRTLADAALKAKELPPPTAGEQVESGSKASVETDILSGEQPSVVVVGSWVQVRRALAALGEACGLEFGALMQPQDLASVLVSKSVLDKETAALIPQLAQLSRMATRGGADELIHPQQAAEYRAIAEEVASKLKQAERLIRRGASVS